MPRYRRFPGQGWYLLAGLLLVAFELCALTPESARFRHLGLEQGLSQPSVKAMAQDRHGFLWLGTQTGLNRWDGSEMRRFHHDRARPGSLSHNNISALRVDAGGQLWVGTDGGGLNRYDAAREVFEVHRHALDRTDSLPDDTVNDLLADAGDGLWVGTEAGLAMWHADSGRFRRAADGAADLRVRALAWADGGALWVGTPSGLLHFDPATGHWDVATLPAGAPARLAVRALLASSDGSLWIGSEAGLSHWHPARGELRHWRHDDAADSLGNDLIGALLRDREGRLWVAHEAGVDLMLEDDHGRASFQHFRHQRRFPQSLGGGRVASLLQDRAGGLWFGTWSGGASLLSPFARRVLSFTPDTPATAALREPEITALAAEEPATLWLGSRGGLFAFDVRERRLRSFPRLAGERIYGLALAADGASLLIGSERGLLHYWPSEDRLQAAPHAGDSVVQVNALLRDGPRLWLGTREPGLVLADAEGLQALRRFPVDGLVRLLAPFDDRLMLVGTAHGLFWHDRDTGEPLYRHIAEPGRPGSLASSTLSSFLHASDGRLWLATAAGGLHRMRLQEPGEPASARFEVFSRGLGPVADTISSLLEGPDGRLWMSSSRGIVRFDPERARFSSFLSVDGSFESGYYANVRAQFASGLMAFGGPEGFTLVDPAAAIDLPAPPAPLLLDLLVDNRPLQPGESALLPAAMTGLDHLALPVQAVRSLGLRFAAPDTLGAAQLAYSYRLDGFDPDWIATDARNRLASYTNLGAGEYRFRVRASNPDGQFSGETVLSLRLFPPWWQTAWARLAGLITLLLAVYATHRWRVRRLDAQRQALAREVDQRTAELRASNSALSNALDDLRQTQSSLVEQEKMASLGGLVAGVAHEINTPIGIALTAASHLGELSHGVTTKLAAGRLTQSDFHAFRDALGEGMRLIMASLDRAHALVTSFRQVAVDQSSEQRREIELGSFLQEARLSLQPSYRLTQHDLKVRCDVPVTLDTYPGALFQIFTHLVNNSLQHGFGDGRPGRMRIEAEAVGDAVRLRYRDNGVGMSEDVLARAFEPFFTTRRGSGSGLGLHIVYNLVTQLLGGRIRLQPQSDGLLIEIDIPKKAPSRIS